MVNKISVLGCGWLGLPLAKSLVSKGWLINGSATSPEKTELLQSQGIEPFLLQLKPELTGNNIEDFFDSEILIINFPPERRDDIISFHTKQIEAIIHFAEKSPVKKIIFASSTSVYKSVNRTLTEADYLPAESQTGEALKIAEQILMNNINFKTTVLRFGGLIGEGRQPGKFFAGKKNIPNGRAPVNLIVSEDCINIINKIIEQNVFGEIFNAVADAHQSRAEFYTAAAKKLNLPAPEFIDELNEYKIISNEKLKQKLNYTFIYPDPLDWVKNSL